MSRNKSRLTHRITLFMIGAGEVLRSSSHHSSAMRPISSRALEAASEAPRETRPQAVYLYLAFWASDSLPHAAPSALPTSPKGMLGLALTILGRSALQKIMYGPGARLTLGLSSFLPFEALPLAALPFEALGFFAIAFFGAATTQKTREPGAKTCAGAVPSGESCAQNVRMRAVQGAVRGASHQTSWRAS